MDVEKIDVLKETVHVLFYRYFQVNLPAERAYLTGIDKLMQPSNQSYTVCSSSFNDTLIDLASFHVHPVHSNPMLPLPCWHCVGNDMVDDSSVN